MLNDSQSNDRQPNDRQSHDREATERENADHKVEIKQPMTPAAVDPAQKQAHKEALAQSEGLTANPGDRIDESKSLEEKAQQVAVDAPDITGDHIVVPTYFIVDEPDGTQKALHHVKDAEEISDVVRQAGYGG